MKRTNYYTITIIGLVFLVGLGLTNGSLYENYLEGRWITSARDYNTSVMIGADPCYTSIYDDTINFTCGGNIAGEVSMEGTLISNGIYGGMYYHNHTETTITFAVKELYYNMFMSESTHNNGFIFTGGFMQESNLTALYDGIYNINYYATGSGVNNHRFHLTIFVNEEEKDNCETHWKLPATGDDVTMSGNCLVNISTGENISLRIADFTRTGEGIYIGSNVVLTRVGNN